MRFATYDNGELADINIHTQAEVVDSCLSKRNTGRGREQGTMMETEIILHERPLTRANDRLFSLCPEMTLRG